MILKFYLAVSQWVHFIHQNILFEPTYCKHNCKAHFETLCHQFVNKFKDLVTTKI